jgi:Tol biopolymer transport system component
LSTVGTAADYRNATIDPAGERVAANTVGAPVTDVWLLDSRRGTTSRITFDPAADSDPLFSPDGKSIVFYSARQPAGIYRKASNGAGADELVAATGLATYPRDWSSDGRFLLYDNGENFGALWALPMDGDRKPARYPPAQSTTFRVFQGHFAPDNRWVAYVSDETGRQEIFVQDFPATGAKFQASVMGGSEPRWRRDGRELTFLAPDGRLMSVGVETKPDFRLGVPKPLFQTRLMNLGIAASRRYAVSADGTRFLMNVPVGGDSLPPITVVLNWQDELKQTAALKK